MADEDLEAPANLGKPFPAEHDPYRDFSRDRATGWLFLLATLLFFATLAYGSERFWIPAAVCAVGFLLAAVGAVRRIRVRVRQEMTTHPRVTLEKTIGLVGPPPLPRGKR
ncbi:MAG: hypothetical protein M3010_06460 [Candidatus Dormibacteraeota bacterium]|nr:hypothetical protein [Candidatus Dormibacteraeota bacterium]